MPVLNQDANSGKQVANIPFIASLTEKSAYAKSVVELDTSLLTRGDT